MKDKKIVIAGGTGFIGQELIRYFGKENDIVILSRAVNRHINNRNDYSDLTTEDLTKTRFVIWDGRTIGSWAFELENCDLLINLAGKSVNCRYTKKNKQLIRQSRVDATTILGEAINSCENPPALWINSSSATIYRDARDHAQDEQSGELGSGFSVDVCKSWEQSFHEQHTPRTRKVILRMAITLGGGGVLIPYFNLLRMMLGGRQGSGTQMYSWIHQKDLCRIIDFIESNKSMTGTYNAAAPTPVTNSEFMATLRKATGHGFGFPVYTWMLRFGAMMMGTETELVLKSRWVISRRLAAAGFIFKFPLLDGAFKDLIAAVPPKQYNLLKR